MFVIKIFYLLNFSNGDTSFVFFHFQQAVSHDEQQIPPLFLLVARELIVVVTIMKKDVSNLLFVFK